ncbi:MAG: hypothetical protein SOW92_06280, partial [Kiritimatiellia bacterium]|nr:hypothetical protein [Kiritimatiellia bacterium]
IVCIIFLSELGVFKKGYDSKSRLKSRPDVQSGRGFRRSSFRIPPKRHNFPVGRAQPNRQLIFDIGGKAPLRNFAATIKCA